MLKKKLINLNKILYYKNQHLKKINNELDSFVYKTPHDLRAPLASMLGLINIAKNESNVDEIKKYIELQERSVKKLDSYIADILEITKNSNQDISYENINLSQLVEESLQQLVYFHDSHKIKISTFINEQEKLYSDRYRLQIILQNLLSNSIRYIDENKTTCIIEIHADVQQYIFILKIVDNGIGIQKDHLDKIFDIFYRASEKSKGSGLGLYIVLYIVKENIARLGGNITVDSEYGKGTTFTITLPNHTLLKNI
ncbi:MAG: HAMP domain-containing histidine kinase [Cytophagaceae bacterium]|nr:HAMP domain-containing histidine kinase [Cytophagaceae bacterium]MDW8455887.1 HAMP domain-containing sensor histidine kinase [Cytophagaceae bacterium]